MEAVLIVTAGTLCGQRFELGRRQRVFVGRCADWADVRLADAGVAERHACFENRDGVFVVSDSYSATGVLVNGERIAPGGECTLRSGDRVQVGEAELRILQVLLAEATPEPPPGRARPHPGPPPAATIRKDYAHEGVTLLPPITGLGADAGAIRRLQRQLDAIYELGNLIHSERRLDQIFSLAVDCILEVSRGERGAILMIDEATGHLREEVVQVRSRRTPQIDLPVNRTILNEILREGVSLLISDAMNDPRFADGVDIHLQTIKSVLCVPVRTEDRITGVIYVDNTSLPETFNESDLRLLTAMGKQIGIAVERGRLVADLEELFVGTIFTLVATIEAKDQYTRGHSERVTTFALAIADTLRLERDQRIVVELSGLLHDVGKIGVPEAVLNKPGRLTDAEAAVIREHPGQGARIIQNINNIDRVVDMRAIVAAVLHHHEYFKGGGYPAGIGGEEIPLAARVLAVADTFDAITSNRSYRQARGPDVAARIIRESSGTQFDPACVEAFMTALHTGVVERAKHTVSRFVPRAGQPRRR